MRPWEAIMSQVLAGAAAPRFENVDAGALAAARWLALAAAPTFAVMALLAVGDGGGPAHLICSAGRTASPLDGMTAMYLLMGVFHLPPWLKLFSSIGRGKVRRDRQDVNGG
jgi:hypothetical protein